MIGGIPLLGYLRRESIKRLNRLLGCKIPGVKSRRVAPTPQVLCGRGACAQNALDSPRPPELKARTNNRLIQTIGTPAIMPD